ncbi:MAG: hypothetical protein OEY80_14620, partial [Nitrospirota bacterium]|nr:hypothetical protein [Nitrospirota bacterium]
MARHDLTFQSGGATAGDGGHTGKNTANSIKLYLSCRQYGDSGQKRLLPSSAGEKIHERRT